jgi:hypothetical protein
MWRPMEIFLYEWWPLLRKGRLYEKAEPDARGRTQTQPIVLTL